MALASAVVAAAGLIAASAAISGRPLPPTERLQGARVAVGRARLGAAPRWAPDELARAIGALTTAETEYARMAARPWPLRDFANVAGRLWSAESAALRAHRVGEERRIVARLEAEDALVESAGLLRAGKALASATALPREERVHLARARLLDAEARALMESEEYLLARGAAERARSELGRALGPAAVRARRYASAERVRTWRRWIEETRAWSRATGRAGIVVVKERNELVLLQGGHASATYAADIGSNALGRKLSAGDLATPEGRYRIVAKKGARRSRYHKALLLDYPNDADRRRIGEALRTGELPPGSRPGGLIEVHGEGGLGRNWTDGCVAVSNRDMDELFRKVDLGAWVTIVGGDGAGGAFSRFSERFRLPDEEER